MTGEDYNPTGMDDADCARITLTGNQTITGIVGGRDGRRGHPMTMERWEGRLGIFDNTEDEAVQARNEALDEAGSVEAFRDTCQTFLRNTRGLKLKPGPMNSHGRQAWSSVLQALSALERYSHD